MGLLALAGCAVGPDFKSPEAATPAGWLGTAPPPTATAPGVDLIHWWTSFNDPMLTSLIERAVQSNLTVRQAEARLIQARAARGVAFALLFPTLDAVSSFDRGRSSGNLGSGKGSSKTSVPTTNLYQMGLDAAWEIDVFGGVRRGVEAADADIQAAVEDLRDALVSLTAEVALNYIDLRGFQQQIEIARENLKAQQKSADLTRRRFQGGLVGGLDAANADAQVATTLSTIPVFEIQAQQTIYNLSVLLGKDPAALYAELSPSAALPVAPPEVPLGLPSDLLRRRPDIRRAEAQIHASTARIGVATADLFPKFNLVGSAGYESGRIGNVTNWNSRFWSFGPSMDWQIFNAGRVASNIAVQRALEEQSLLTYQQTVRVALQDVENALIASTKELEHRKALADAVAANLKAVKFATDLYTQGQTDFLNVLNAQRSLFAVQDALVQSNRSVSTDLVALYKALGGGWDGPPQSPAAPPAAEKQEAGK